MSRSLVRLPIDPRRAQRAHTTPNRAFWKGRPSGLARICARTDQLTNSGSAPSGRVPELSLWRVLVDRLEGVPEVELRDLAAEDGTRRHRRSGSAAPPRYGR